MLMAPLCRPAYIVSRTARGWLRRLMPPAGWRPRQTVGEQQTSIAEVGVDGGTSASSGVSRAIGLVNINTASAAELQTLSGIGPSMAQSIIDERTKNGAFASVDDLMRVSGIGEKKLAKIKDCICV